MILTPALWAMMPGCAIVLIVMWIIFGKDKKTIPVITTRPPANLDPLEIEYAQIATITDRGIYAELLYWVSQGYLEIKSNHDGDEPGADERTGGGTEGRGDSTGRTDDITDGSAEDRIAMRKVSDLPPDAPEHARFLFEGLFGKSDTVWLDRFPPEIADHKDQILERVKTRFKGRNAVVQDDSMAVTVTAIGVLIVVVFVLEVMVDVGVWVPAILGVALFTALAFLQNGALGFRSKYIPFEVIVGAVGTALILFVHLLLLHLHGAQALFLVLFAVCFLVSIPCILFMERRVNHRLYGQILGFREFIKTAEWDRLKQLTEDESEDSQENGPGYGMSILPYAMLFNMGTKWTAQFENMTIYHCVEKMEDALAEKEK